MNAPLKIDKASDLMGKDQRRERARVRGNETPPTKTAGRILQAQLDKLLDSELTITSSAKPVDGGSASARKGR
jgi:hypothetical protein